MNRSTAALTLSAAPALADNAPRTQRDRDKLIGGCIMTYDEQHKDRCVEILEGPAAIGRRARQGYEWRSLRDEIDRPDHCRDNPRVVSPRVCFEEFGRSR